MDELLSYFLDKTLILQNQAVIQISGYDMDYFEYLCDDGQVLIYRSHKNPVMTKVIIVKDKNEFNYALPEAQIGISHFLEYYLSLSRLSSNQLSLITGRLEEISYYLRNQYLFYQIDRPENVRLINIIPQDLKQAMRDYSLLINLVKRHAQQTVVKLFLELNIDIQTEYFFARVSRRP